MKDSNNLIARKAMPEDVDIIFEWANDEDTRKQSFNSDKIEYENHVKWFEKKIADKKCLFLIFETNNDDHIPVGCVRLDLDENIQYLLSYQIAPDMRGKGLGKIMINDIDYVLPQIYGVEDIDIVAEVKKQNIASCKCFEGNGYRKEEKEEINVYRKHI